MLPKLLQENRIPSLLVNYGFTLEEADGILKHESLLYAISHVYVFFVVLYYYIQQLQQ